MGTPEENKKIVQKRLDDRKERRKKALNDAKQDAITMQMISIVNNHCTATEAKKQLDIEARNERKRTNKKITKLKKCGNTALNRIYLSVALAAWSGLFYAIGLTKLWSLIVCVVLAVAYLALNTYALVQNAGKIAELT